MLDSVDYRDNRLENWARWLNGGLAGARVTSGIWTFTGRDSSRTVGSDGDIGSALVGDAMDTDDLVRRLEADLRHAVHAWYCALGTQRDKARELGCHPDTLRRRVDAAKVRLDELDHARRVQAQRAAGARGREAL
jgi:hypothetical protein